MRLCAGEGRRDGRVQQMALAGVQSTSEPVSGGVFIETYGCQMNLVDSEIVMAMLEERGYRRVDRPDQAELVLINTCAVREHAEVRAIQNISRFKHLKEKGRDVRVGVLGCLSEYAADQLAGTLPFLDWILGPDAYRRLPGLLAEPSSEIPLIFQGNGAEELYDDILPSRRSGVNAWVTVSRGCDNHCTYCVVPATRGRLRHRAANSILDEVKMAVDQGFVQVTLLGQNVNDYRDGNLDFAGLMEKVSKVPGLRRLRFMTSHPKDLSERLIDVLASGGPICPELHLPLQSGSDRVLKRMNRAYTADQYRGLVESVRKRVPGLLLSTDIIVGFPGESERDYHQTEQIVRETGFDDAFIYKYSERPHTPAAKLKDDVENAEKVRRLMILNDIVRASGQSRRLQRIGRTERILVEGPSARNESEQMGRTRAGYVVIVPGAYLSGNELDVRITSLSGYTLRGRAV